VGACFPIRQLKPVTLAASSDRLGESFFRVDIVRRSIRQALGSQ